MNHLLFKYLWFRACAALNFHCFHNPVVIKEWLCARMETLLPSPRCASPLAHVWDGYAHTVALLQDIDYSHMTAEHFPPFCPPFVLRLWSCVFNQSHPICMESFIWQLFSIQNKYAHAAESSL